MKPLGRRHNTKTIPNRRSIQPPDPLLLWAHGAIGRARVAAVHGPAQARRGPAPVAYHWSLLLLLPETEQGHAPRAVGVVAVIRHRFALHERRPVHGSGARAGHANNNGAAATYELRLRPLYPL